MSRPRAEAPTATVPPWQASLAVFLTLTSVATLLGVIAYGDNQLRIDLRVLEAAQRLDLPGLDTIVRVSNLVFGTAGALVVVALLAVAALVLHRPVFVQQLGIVTILRLAGQVLKPLFDSPRPPESLQPDPSLVSSTLGYPSGHAYTAAVITTMLVLFVASLDVARWAKRVTLAVAMLVAVTAMFSRVAIGAHWPTDTVGGLMYGIATVALMQLISGAVLARRKPTVERHTR